MSSAKCELSCTVCIEACHIFGRSGYILFTSDAELSGKFVAGTARARVGLGVPLILGYIGSARSERMADPLSHQPRQCASLERPPILTLSIIATDRNFTGL